MSDNIKDSAENGKSQEYKNESKEFFDQLANHYDSSIAGRKSKMLHGLVIKTMDKFEYKSVLDVGYGNGNFLIELLKRKRVAAAGIDLSEKMLEQSGFKLISWGQVESAFLLVAIAT